MEKQSFLFYIDWYDMAKDEPNEQRLALYDAIVRYAFDGEEPTDISIRMAFKLIKNQIDRDAQKYVDRASKNKAAIQARWERTKKKQTATSESKSIQTNTNEYECIQTNTNHTDNDNVNVNVNDNVLQDTNVSMSNNNLRNINISMSDLKKSNAPKDIKVIVDYWNESVKSHNATIKPIKSVRADGKKHISIRARLNEYGIDAIKEAIDYAMQNPFLNGNSKSGWLADADWFFKPNNFEKVYAQNWDDVKPQPSAPQPQQPAQPIWQPGTPQDRVQAAKNGTQSFEAWCAQNGKNPDDSATGIEYFNFIKQHQK